MRIFKDGLGSEGSQFSNAVSALSGAKRRILIAFLKGQYGRWSLERSERQERAAGSYSKQAFARILGKSLVR